MRVGPHATALIAQLEALGGIREDQLAGAFVVLPEGHLVAAAQTAYGAGFDLLLDVYAIDWLTFPEARPKRFSVSYHMHHLAANERLSLRIHIDEGSAPATVTGIWPAANYMEREVYDLFGIEFLDHPDLRKLVTPEDLEGHPLRKDFPIGESPTLFNDGRFLDPASFRAGMIGASPGRTGWIGGARRGVRSTVEDGGDA
jgi:NADH-quinone oxidoreductase subunit C